MRHFKIKNIFSYVVVAALVAALSISCKSNEEPPKDNTHSNHPPSGEYKGRFYPAGDSSQTVESTITVTTSGDTCNIKGSAFYNASSDKKDYEITIKKWFGSTSSGYVLLENGQNYSGQATITSPKGTTRFFVEHDAAYNISVSFTLDGKNYKAHGDKP